MIVTRTPFRVSFCGGGTDIPSHYLEHGGCTVSTTIYKYMYITLARSFHDSTFLKYSVVENIRSFDEIKHPIYKELLRKYDIRNVEINSTSDIPAGTGLGSSSAFTVGLINSLRTFKHCTISKRILAEEACETEIDKLGEPIGKQDQYASAYGGLNFIRYNKDNTVDVERIDMYPDDKKNMFDRMMMFYVGGTRDASRIISGYGKSKTSAEQKNKMSQLAEKLKYNLQKGNIDSMGKILDEGWRIKKSFSQDVSNPQIDELYDKAMDNGASGGKLLGAGGNGFMLFYVNDDCKESVRKALSDYREISFTFDDDGSKVVYSDEM